MVDLDAGEFLSAVLVVVADDAAVGPDDLAGYRPALHTVRQADPARRHRDRREPKARGEVSGIGRRLGEVLGSGGGRPARRGFEVQLHVGVLGAGSVVAAERGVGAGVEVGDGSFGDGAGPVPLQFALGLVASDGGAGLLASAALEQVGAAVLLEDEALGESVEGVVLRVGVGEVWPAGREEAEAMDADQTIGRSAQSVQLPVPQQRSVREAPVVLRASAEQTCVRGKLPTDGRSNYRRRLPRLIRDLHHPPSSPT